MVRLIDELSAWVLRRCVRWQVSRLGNQRGASAIEYALIASVIAVGIAAALAPVRDAIMALFADIAATLSD